VIPLLGLLLAVLGWVISVLATFWYVRVFHQMLQEMRAIRRYLHALYERGERR